MHSLSGLFSTFAASIRRTTDKIPFDRLLKASESPAGFASIAGIGLVAVIMLNISGSTDPYDRADAVHDTSVEKPPLPAAARPAAHPTDSAADTLAQDMFQPPEIETASLRRGETLIGLLRRANFSNANAHAVVNELKGVTNLRKLQRGQVVRFSRQAGASNRVKDLYLRDTFGEEAIVAFNDTGYKAGRVPVKTVSLTHLVEGEITDNLYLSAKREGLPDSVIIDLIRMMSFNVDFEREIRQGDRFQVYFERRYAPSFDDMENGRILYVDLSLRQKPVNATWFEDSEGNSDYFDDSGASTRRALMKTPLDVAVVTSRYGKRKHPVLGYTRMHQGVDFRAPTGTPIMAAGDGVIEMAARNGSYGNYIRIRHNDTYKTAYGHLSRFGKGIKRGTRVKQGQVIGYSGATGRVTAAHLHYEVLVGGKQSNPMTLKLPTGRVLDEQNLIRFREARGMLVADIERIRLRDRQLAALPKSIVQAR